MQATCKLVLAAVSFAVLLTVPTASAQTPAVNPPGNAADEGSAAEITSAAPRLAGVWRTPPDRFPLLTDFDKSVWGPNAQSEQRVELTLNASGEGTLTIKRRVIDGKGRTVLGSASVDQVKVSVGAPSGPAVATRLEHAVAIANAERRYADDPSYRWAVDGARVSIVTFEGGDPNAMEVRYDTADGKVAVAEVLRRAGTRTGVRPDATARRATGTKAVRR